MVRADAERAGLEVEVVLCGIDPGNFDDLFLREVLPDCVVRRVRHSARACGFLCERQRCFFTSSERVTGAVIGE